MDQVGAYEAKTHLPRLLEEVERGRVITITRHGSPVARLVPVRGNQANIASTIAALRQARQGVTLGRIRLRQLIDAGRR